MAENRMLEIGVIGGSGVLLVPGGRHRGPGGHSLWDPQRLPLLGEIAGRKVAFLPRHGRGHHLPPAPASLPSQPPHPVGAAFGRGAPGASGRDAVGGLREEYGHGHAARTGPAGGPYEGARPDLLRRASAADGTVPGVVHTRSPTSNARAAARRPWARRRARLAGRGRRHHGRRRGPPLSRPAPNRSGTPRWAGRWSA